MAKKIFICFSTSGGGDVARHVNEFCKRQEYEPFLSEEIRSGDIWREEREKALKDCDIFLFIATYDAFSRKDVAYEIRKANELQKRIIPCKHTLVEWSKVEEIGINTQGITFETKEELIREIGPRLEKEFGIISTRSQDNNKAQLQHHEIIEPTKSNYWRIREIEQHLEDVSDLDEELANPAFFIGWLYRVDSSLKEMFGEKSKYYRNFPRFSLHELSDITLPFDYPNTRFKMAKKPPPRDTSRN